MSDLPTFDLEAQSAAPIAGIDEAGRGPWAGPVVAAAVVLDPANIPKGLNDSKKLSAKRREALLIEILAAADVGIGAASAPEIDRVNILNATFLAMTRAYAHLKVPAAAALVDGNKTPTLPCPARAIVKGDAKSVSIAAASIVAKVTRDRIMTALCTRYPGFGWSSNKGYGARIHRDGLETFGLTPHHRLSFAPMKDMPHNILYADSGMTQYQESA